MQRPDLSKVDHAVKAYIEYLEAELNRGQSRPRDGRMVEREEPPDHLAETLPAEPATTMGVITVSMEGMVKRTLRHLYPRQRRAGIGIFDLEFGKSDFPKHLVIADENQNMLLFTDHARAYLFPAGKISTAEVRSRGGPAFDRLPIEADEQIAAIVPGQASGYLALVSQRGMVRSLRHHLFGEYLKPGTSFYNFREFGPLAAVCWTPGNADLLIASQKGMAIRFSEKLVPPNGTLGIRLDPDDRVVGVTAVTDDSGVLLLGSDGRGAIRQMSAFHANKSAGGGGKIALKTEKLVACSKVDPTDDVFIITRLGKIIRFNAGEVPVTEGAVQGVYCITLRGDETCAIAISPTQASSIFR
jgi:DNA gyrase subunit A